MCFGATEHDDELEPMGICTLIESYTTFCLLLTWLTATDTSRKLFKLFDIPRTALSELFITSPASHELSCLPPRSWALIHIGSINPCRNSVALVSSMWLQGRLGSLSICLFSVFDVSGRADQFTRPVLLRRVDGEAYDHMEESIPALCELLLLVVSLL